ncbi:unnamed protein product, partial [marine sediment metagenome]
MAKRYILEFILKGSDKVSKPTASATKAVGDFNKQVTLAIKSLNGVTKPVSSAAKWMDNFGKHVDKAKVSTEKFNKEQSELASE